VLAFCTNRTGIADAVQLLSCVRFFMASWTITRQVSPSSAHHQAHGHWSTVHRCFVLVSDSNLQTVNSGGSRSTTSFLFTASSILSNQGLILELCGHIHDNSSYYHIRDRRETFHIIEQDGMYR